MLHKAIKLHFPTLYLEDTTAVLLLYDRNLQSVAQEWSLVEADQICSVATKHTGTQAKDLWLQLLAVTF